MEVEGGKASSANLHKVEVVPWDVRGAEVEACTRSPQKKEVSWG